jgi:hypothetical protein
MALKKFKLDDLIVLDIAACRNANRNRSGGITWLSDAYFQKAKNLEGVVGKITTVHPTGWEYNVEFPDANHYICLHAKHGYLRNAEKQTVLMPIRVPAGGLCWDHENEARHCQFYDNAGGHPVCGMGLGNLKMSDTGEVNKCAGCLKLNQK